GAHERERGASTADAGGAPARAGGHCAVANRQRRFPRHHRCDGALDRRHNRRLRRAFFLDGTPAAKAPMIEVSRFGDVQRVRMWTWRTSAVGYDVSAYLVHGLLVDTGFRHVARELQGVLSGLRPRGLIVTHWHEDHAGNAPMLADSRMPMWVAPYTEA